ncbi:MAG: threonine ammonia-lyase [Chloroflexi bacterium]|nr:threonine ammonia-lyase [Chloroflexota bacterium]
MPTVGDIDEARAVVSRIAHHTPLLSSRQLSDLTGATVLMKAENLQRTGSFKVRGAMNKLASLTSEERTRGVIAASAGNHAQGVALAARELGLPCTVVMPEAASLAKVQATRGYGARVLLHGDTFEDALRHAQQLGRDQRLAFIHAFDDPRVIAGQGTLGLEVLEDAGNPDTVLVPVGGGGLIAGVALVVKERSPRTRVVGVQAEAAPAAVRSFQAGRRLRAPEEATLADGIALAQPGKLPFEIMSRCVDDMVAVSEEAIAHAQVLLLERGKLLVEGAGAVGLAALLEGKVPRPGTTVVVLSGGNVDLNLVERILEHGLAEAGRYLSWEFVLLDRPGRLSRLLAVLADVGVNVLEVVHQRQGAPLPVGQVLVQVTGETRDPAHASQVEAALTGAGYRPATASGRGGHGVPRFVDGETVRKPRRVEPKSGEGSRERV